jgi:hypothetical protein
MIFEKTILEILNEENFLKRDLCRIATNYEIHFAFRTTSQATGPKTLKDVEHFLPRLFSNSMP